MIETTSNEEIERTIGKRLKGMRLEQNVSQAELASLAGISRKTVSSVESGGGCALSTLIRMLRALGQLAKLEELLREPDVSPINIHYGKDRQRQRASGSRVKEQPNPDWQWGDDG
jgi:predicted transcriptional regulator